MNFNKYYLNENNKFYLLFFLFASSFLVRIPVIFFLGDINIDNEWNFLVGYLVDYKKIYSIFPSLVNSFLRESSLELLNYDSFFAPNVFMPPLYAFYLYLFKLFILNNDLYVLTVLFSQNFLSSFSVVIFYLISKNFFSTKISILGSLIFAFFPLHVYATAQASSATLQSFLTVIFFYYFFEITKKNNLSNIIFFSFTSGLLILLRGEFIAFFLFSILYLMVFLKIKIKNILIIIFFTIITISPYLVRNLILLDKITITKSIGYNLWKGNNPSSTVEGNSKFDLDLRKKISEVPNDKYYDINADKVFQDEALKNIKNNPNKYLNLYIKKFFSYILIDLNSSYPHYYNPFHYVPVLLIGITSIIGIILSDKKSSKMNYLILFFIGNITIISFFFILPRYALAVLPLQILFSNILFKYIRNHVLKIK